MSFMYARIPSDDESCSSRLRGPSFSHSETNLLLDLIEKYKIAVLNRETKATFSKAKEEAWKNIEREFNGKKLKCERVADSLKTKWENLKRTAHKLLKKDESTTIIDDETTRVLNLVKESNKLTGLPMEALEELLNNTVPESLSTAEETPVYYASTPSQLYPATEDNDKKKFKKMWNNSSSDESDGLDDKRSSRSLNFAPQECLLLLKCVNKERKIIMSPSSSIALKQKAKAWARVHEAFNARNSEPRSLKTLQTKFTNMKATARQTNQRFNPRSLEMMNRFSNECIKQEPINIEIEMEGEDSDHDDTLANSSHDRISNNDPLDGGSNYGQLLNDSMFRNNAESSEVSKRKLELIKYQMETAEMERKWLISKMTADEMDRNHRSTETSLRLRTARLELLSAEAKFPSGHPALAHGPEETLAQTYTNVFGAIPNVQNDLVQ